MHAWLGKGAGLVDADGVNPREDLDSGQVLNEDLLLREPKDRDGHGDAREQDEAFGDHRHHAGDRAPDRLVERQACPDDLRVQQERTDGEQDE